MTPDEMANPIQLAAGEILVTSLHNAVVLPSGHQARGLPCLICGKALGSLPVDQVCLWPVSTVGCTCGRVDVVAFLAHSDHRLPGVRQLAKLARTRLATAHAGEQVNL